MKTKQKSILKMTALLAALIFSLIPMGQVSANGGIEATLTLEAGDYTVGDVIPIMLTVTHPAGYHLITPQFKDEPWGALEVREVALPQIMANPDGTETTIQTIYVTLWEPGEFSTPELPLAISDTAGEIYEISALPLSFLISSVIVEGDSNLRDIKPQATLPLPSILPWVISGLLITGLIALAISWFLRRWRQKRKFAQVNAPDLRKPYEVAFDELAHIAEQSLPSQSRYKEHYTLVSDVLRQYIEKSFRVPMLDRTTGEIRRSINEASINQDSKSLLTKLLNEADWVKFAKVKPSISQADDYLQETRRLIKATHPKKVVIENGKKEEIKFIQQSAPLMEAK